MPLIEIRDLNQRMNPLTAEVSRVPNVGEWMRRGAEDTESMVVERVEHNLVSRGRELGPWGVHAVVWTRIPS